MSRSLAMLHRSRKERGTTYPSHKDDAVNTHPPLFGQHSLRLDPKGTGCFPRARLLRLKELLGLREQDSHEADSDREAGADPEDTLPRADRISYAQVDTGCENVSKCVALLQDAAHQTTCVDPAEC